MSAFRTLVAVVGGDQQEDPVYECEQCETGFAIEYHCCPECGCYRVDRTDWAVE